MRLSQAAEMLGVPLVGEDREINAVNTDSRTLQAGDLFIALKGPNFNGHDFLQQALAKQAAGAVVSEDWTDALPSIRVGDTRVALGRLAAGWRLQRPTPLVALTGSNGKTTVKSMIASMLARRGAVLATPGNLNNDIGMPLTLLRLRDEDFVVLEMGANHAGEIAYLTAIARPDVALITNAGHAHLEGFGDLAGVARAKGEIFQGLSKQGVAVLNADDPYLDYWRERVGSHPVRTFGFNSQAEVRAARDQVQTRWLEKGYQTRFQVHTPTGEFTLELALAGEHNVRNALAAIAVCQALGIDQVDIQRGLAEMRPVSGRLQVQTSPTGLRVINDSYNANPASLDAAIQVLRQAPGRRWLILGDLAELGAQVEELHRQVGERARQSGIDALWCVGPLSRATAEGYGEGARHFDTQAELIDALMGRLGDVDTILVKGSRSARMERVVQALLQTEV